ncbi:MAG TPA: four helix bundle protein [Patescibacteria group bacterium]
MKFRFEKLEIWQDAINFANKIYYITKKFPQDEKFGLASQLRRAAVSVALNIAEGTNRNTTKDRKHFFQMSITSVDEVVTALYISLNQGYITKKEFDLIYQDAGKQTARTASFIKSLK